MPTLPTVKSETAAASPGEILIKQEMEHETDGNWDIVSQHSSRSLSLSSSSTECGRWEDDKPSSKSLQPLYYFSLGDPTNELRNRIELSGIGLSSALVSSLPPRSLNLQQSKLTSPGFPRQHHRFDGPRMRSNVLFTPEVSAKALGGRHRV